jgi:hypothetical protein
MKRASDAALFLWESRRGGAAIDRVGCPPLNPPQRRGSHAPRRPDSPRLGKSISGKTDSRLRNHSTPGVGTTFTLYFKDAALRGRLTPGAFEASQGGLRRFFPDAELENAPASLIAAIEGLEESHRLFRSEHRRFHLDRIEAFLEAGRRGRK